MVDDDILDLQITTLGLLDLENEVDQAHFDKLETQIDQTVTKMPKKDRQDDKAFEDRIRQSAKRFFHEGFNAKPLVEIHITLLD